MTDPAPMAPFQALLDVVREEFGRVAYSHKTHQKMVDRLNCRILWEKRVNAALVTATAGNTVGVLVTNAELAKIAALTLSAAALLVTVYGMSRNRDRLLELHRRTALGLWMLREDYVHLICDLKGGTASLADARARRDALTKTAARIYASAPDTDPKAYQSARKALKTDEELTFSPEEIDVMLPRALRSNVIPPSSSSSPSP